MKISSNQLWYNLSYVLRLRLNIISSLQVFDLTEGGPQPAIELFKKVPNVRFLACGGDGTVGWLLSVLDKVPIDPLPPVGVLPLGTGNDLSRSLGETLVTLKCI